MVDVEEYDDNIVHCSYVWAVAVASFPIWWFVWILWTDHYSFINPPSLIFSFPLVALSSPLSQILSFKRYTVCTVWTSCGCNVHFSVYLIRFAWENDSTKYYLILPFRHNDRELLMASLRKKYIVHIHLKQKPWGPHFVRPATEIVLRCFFLNIDGRSVSSESYTYIV